MVSDSPTTIALERYTADARALIVAAQALADQRQHPEVTPLHVLVQGFARVPLFSDVLRRAKVDVLELQAAAERAVEALPRGTAPAHLSESLLDLMSRARRDATRDGSGDVALEHVFNALSQEVRGPAGEVLTAFNVGPGALRPHMAQLRATGGLTIARSGAEVPSSSFTRDLIVEERREPGDPVIGRDAELRRLLTVLERRQKHHPLLVGEAGVGKRAMVRALARRIAGGDVPTSLVGVRLLQLELGALVAGARLKGDIDGRLRSVIQSAVGRGEQTLLVVREVDQLFAPGGTGGALGDVLKPALERGEVRLLATVTPEGMRRIQARDPVVLRLFTPLSIAEPSVEQTIEIVRGLASRYESHHRVKIGDGAIVAAVRLAKRYLQDRFLPDSAFDLLDEAGAAKRVAFDGVPPDVDEAVRRLESLEAQLASLDGSEDRVTVETRGKLRAEADLLHPRVSEMKASLESRRGAVAAVRSISLELEGARTARTAARDRRDYALLGELDHVTIPDLQKRLDAAESAAQSAGLTEGPAVLDEASIAETLAVWTGIPVAKMLEQEAEKLLKMEERLARRVVGQEDAVAAIARAVRRGRVGLRDPKKPIGSFLFLGTSGVGKTELAKALAEFLFDDEQALTRLDMSEFMERHMAQRLLGAPPGYADSEQGGFLTEAVRRRPYSVLLFDEVEKAHQDVFNLLLQVLDDGRLTDGRGRTADFSNTVVIMTSNIGSERIMDTAPALFESPDGRDALRDVLLGTLSEFFRPEFLNRVGDVVVFRPLAKTHLRSIVDILLTRVQRLLDPRGITLDVDDAACDQLVELGYEPALGARPLQRAILKHIQDPLAGALLSGSHAEGAQLRVTWDAESQVFLFSSGS